jgi:hypothetical protein
MPAPELWPNPAHGTTTVALAEQTPGPVTYELFDVLGRAQWRTTDAETAPMARQQTLSLETLPMGTYLLRVTSPIGQRTARLVVD